MINNNLIISLGMASISMMTNGCIPSSDLAGNSVYEPPPTTEIGTGYINDTYNTEEIKFSVMGDYAVLDGDIMLGLVSELQSTTASSSFVMKNSFFICAKITTIHSRNHKP